jgi:regulator of sigma E protease
MAVVIFILGIVLFLALVITHEMGHFLVAKRGGVKAEEFGVFFPPRLWKKRMKGGWDFTINLLPLGGFVKLKGEHDSDTETGSFGAASDLVKAKIMLAGVAVNLVTALVLFTVLALVGMPQIVDKQFAVASDVKTVREEVRVGLVSKNSPATKAGLREQDVIKTIALVTPESCQTPETCNVSGAVRDITTAESLKKTTRALAGKTVRVTYARAGKPGTVIARLNSDKAVAASQKTDNPQGYLGVVPQELTLKRSTWSAPIVAVGLSAQFTHLTFQGIGQALKGLGGIVAGTVTGNVTARQHAQTAASEQVSGPLGIFFVLKGGSSLGLIFVLFIIAIISLTLAIMNVLPIPALDGGRLYMMLASRKLTKSGRLTPDMEERIVGGSFVALLGLIVLITIVDVKRFF